jgi:hypothetical protein
VVGRGVDDIVDGRVGFEGHRADPVGVDAVVEQLVARAPEQGLPCHRLLVVALYSHYRCKRGRGVLDLEFAAVITVSLPSEFELDTRLFRTHRRSFASARHLEDGLWDGSTITESPPA